MKSIYLSHKRSAKKKILVFGGFGKEINRQLRMKMRTYVKKRLVTDKGTFYSAQDVTYTVCHDFFVRIQFS